jgi:hypothetical protein
LISPVFVRRPLLWLRPVAALAGLAAFIGGVVALFTIDNSAGSLFLITLGVALVLVSILGRRIQIESFEFMGAKIKVLDVVRSRLELALAGSNGEAGRGAAMREQALTLQKLASLYDLYAYVRRTQRYSPERTATLDEIAARMREAASEGRFDPAEVSTWFHQGDDPLRVVALNIMLVHEECRDFLAVLKTLEEPRSLFEQFYALHLALRMLPSLQRFERHVLGDAIGAARRKRRFRRDPPIMSLSGRILAELGR